MGQAASCLGADKSHLHSRKSVEQDDVAKKLPKHIERISGEELPAVSKLKIEYITAECNKDEDEVSLNPASPRNDSAFQPTFEPLDQTPPITDEQSQRRSMQGLQFENVNLGPPKPPCNEARLATLKALECTDGPSDPELKHIIQLACTVFGTSNALVALLDSDRIIIRNGSGMFAPGDFPWRYSFCGYTLSTPNNTTMVVEDALQDARFKHNPYVNGNPPVRFYCGTPLIASNGHRLGTLCFADNEAHSFDAERCNILNNMAELCVREIERSAVMRRQSMESTEHLINAGMMRALEAFQEAILMVDATDGECWRVLHVNRTFSEQTGILRQEIANSPFWDTFALDGSMAPCMMDVQERAEDNKEFALGNVVLRQEYQRTGAVDSCPPFFRAFSMGFRPANHGQLDNSIPIGVPSYMPSVEESGKGIYFVTMQELSTLSWQSTVSSILSDISMREPPFPDLELGMLLGKGSYGSVYRGTFNGQPCAVKVIDDLNAIVMRDGEPLEASITEGMSHPNIVNTIAHTVTHNSQKRSVHSGSDSGSMPGHSATASSKPSGGSKRSSGDASSDSLAWLVLEFCDKGCLQEAIDKGWFRKERQLTAPNIPDVETILATARDIAEGMAFLHARDVVHGDLTGGNVLLTSCDSTPHGFRAKVSDFGLARNLNIQSKIETRTYGTITHMPLELLCDGIMSKACDVYAFGVLLWEMMAGCRAWASMKHAQIMHSIVVERKSLQFPAHTPQPYRALAQQCLSYTPSERPSFDAIIASLEAMRA